MNRAEQYSNSNNCQKIGANYALKNFFHLLNWKEDVREKILDVGSGSGEVTVDILAPLLPKNLVSLLGCDISQEMVDYANSKYKSDKVGFFNLDIATDVLPLELEENFNHIFSFYCLQWVKDQKQAFTNIYKMLKPGGEVFLLFPDEVAVSNIYKRLQKNNKWSKYLENVNEVIPDYSIYNIKVALKKVGFSKHYCKTFRQEIREESDKNFKDSIFSVDPFAKLISKDKIGMYKDDFIRSIIKEKCAKFENGQFLKHFEYVFIYASKKI